MARPESIQWQHRRWLGDKDVLAMDWDAKAMHFHLLLMSIQEQPPGSIPNDMAAIRRWLHLSPDAASRCQSTKDCRCDECVWRRVRPQIFAAWKLRGDRWFNQGMVETFERKEKYNTRYETGTKTVRESTENQENSNSIKELDFDVGSKEKIFKRKEDIETVKKIAEPYLDEIYKLYPRHTKPIKAKKSIAAALKRLLDGKESPAGLFASMDDVVVYLKQRTALFARSPAGNAGEYTPYPASWYNAGSYLEDEMEWSRRGEGDVKPSKKQQRVANNQKVLVEGFFGADAEPSGEGDQLRDNQRGRKALGAAAGVPPGRN